MQQTQITAQINTPAGATKPFGSNMTYEGMYMLPTNLPTSGTYMHAQDAADAYTHWKTNYVEACGTDKFRVKYDNPGETVSEGIAYGMLLAAYAADKTLFDGLWAYYKEHMNANGVMNWKVSGCSSVVGTGGAADAEVDAAMALLVADHQWPASSTPHDYASDAADLISAIKDYEIQPTTNNGPYQLNNGDQWGFWNDCRNPSYQPPAYFKAYGDFMDDTSFWDNCVTASYDLLNANVHPTTGLVSNWSDHNGTPNWCNGPNEYGWDACRNPWRMATDVAWYDDANAKAICDNIATYVESTGVSSVSGPVPQSGGTSGYHSPTFVSTFALAVMASDPGNQDLLDDIYTENVAVMDGLPWYFGNTLRCISLFMMTGNFWNPLASTEPTPSTYTFEANLLLEGAYLAGGQMTTELATSGLIPTDQPFNTAPWNYTGTESASSIPANITDWVLLDIRELNDPNSPVEQKAVLLRNDGALIDPLTLTEGAVFQNLNNSTDYQMIVRPRNHLAIVSENTINFPQSESYDFTQQSNVLLGSTQLVDMEDGYFALLAGDFNADGVITVADLNGYLAASSSINTYNAADFNLDDTVTVSDFNTYKSNLAIIGVSLVQY